MVRVYRSDLGFGQGTDGQNYYEVSEDRAKELEAAGYSTNPSDADAGRSNPGGSIFTGTDDVSFYSDVDAAMSGVSDTASGRSASTGAALAKSLFSMYPDKLVDLYAGYWVQYGNEEIAKGMLIKTPEYKKEFGYLLREDGTMRMTEIEAMSNKASFKNTLAEFGIPYSEAFNKQFETMIENDVSPLEFDTRVNTVYEAVIDDIPQVAELYASQYNISGATPELILAGLINPDIQDAILNNDIDTLRIGAEGVAAGFTFDFDRVNQLRKAGFTRQTAKNLYTQADPMLAQAASLNRDLDISDLEDAAVGNAEAMSAVNKATNEALSQSSFITGSRKKGDKITGLTT